MNQPYIIRYHGATNHRPSRYSVTGQLDGVRREYPYDHGAASPEAAALKTHCRRLGLAGKFTLYKTFTAGTYTGDCIACPIHAGMSVDIRI